ncbi:MAG: KamA family radical SAM protein, partial [candidate division Zixibacteria bacterium]|nr:KamA family radical SAM protein [candidate division Zixibacteria bacterium]
MSESFVYDPSNERQHYALAGLQHKYRETVLLFVSRDCHSTCKWCFRKRLFDGQDLEDDQIVDPIAALDYLRTHKEVRSVLLSGGDAALADPDLLRELFEGIAG